MKFSTLKIGLTIGAIVAFGCAQKKEEASKTLYNTSFAMSGSAKQTVAVQFPLQDFELGPLQKLMDFLMPTATAAIPTSLVDSQNTVINLTAAWIVVKEIEFKSAETTEQENEEEASEVTEFKGPYFVNLLSATPQVLDTKSIAVKVLRRIEMKLESTSVSAPADAPAGLANRSMYLAGTFGANNTAFSFSSADGTEFKVSGANGVTPEEGQDILMSIRFADIIRKINLAALADINLTNKDISDANRVPSVNPCPTIEVGLQDLFTCFRKGLESEADFGKDADGSGELEENEDKADN